MITGGYSKLPPRRPDLLPPMEVLKETQITHLNSSLLAQLDLPKMDSFWFPSIGRVQVQGFIIKPPGLIRRRSIR